MDDLQNREYNGWENRCTWLVHLHLSNEQALFLEIAHLVACEPNDERAGHLVEQWGRASITSWINRVPTRNRPYDEQIGLLVWDLLGAALAYIEWDELVTFLFGGESTWNMFTGTLSSWIEHSSWLQGHIGVMMQEASSLVAAADRLKEWFGALLADWIDKMALGCQVDTKIAVVFSDLLQHVYDLVVWEHVARAFRPDY